MTPLTTLFVVIGVGYVTALLMRVIEWLDTPRKKVRSCR